MRNFFPALATLGLFYTSTAASAADPDAMARCQASVDQGKWAEAEPLCATAAASLPAADGKLLLADLQLLKGDLSSAITQYTEMLRARDQNNLSPTEISALGHRARAYLEAGEDLWAAEDVIAYLKHRPDDVDVLLIGAHSASSSERQIEYAQRLVALQPNEIQHRIFLAGAYVRAKQGKLAVEAAEKALELDPKSDLALTWRGFGYLTAGDHARAEKDLSTVVRRTPKDPESRANLGEALLQMKRYPEVIATASEALKLDADHFRSHVLRAHARLEMGDGEGALADYQSARRVSNNEYRSDLEQRAKNLTEMHQVFARENVAIIEADRQALIDYVANDLRSECGYYVLPDYEDNENLNAYRKCVVKWKTNGLAGGEEAMGENMLKVMNRFYANEKWLDMSPDLRCSKMPKKARCVDDATYARVEMAFQGMDDPRIIIGSSEYERLNTAVRAYNARLERSEKVGKYVSFMQALSDALAEQSEQ